MPHELPCDGPDSVCVPTFNGRYNVTLLKCRYSLTAYETRLSKWSPKNASGANDQTRRTVSRQDQQCATCIMTLRTRDDRRIAIHHQAARNVTVVVGPGGAMVDHVGQSDRIRT
jgi:hypothetical protein